jgi:hypothetical protein
MIRKHAKSHRTAYHILSLLFKMMNNVKEVNPYPFSILFFEEPLISSRCTIRAGSRRFCCDAETN